MSENPRDKQIVFTLISSTEDTEGVKTLAFLIPEAAWANMSAGRTQLFDMTTWGLPLKIIVSRCESHEHAISLIQPLLDVADVVNANGIRAPETKH